MDEKLRQTLLARNRAIIDAILKRARRFCLKMPDLIAVNGSFANGEYYEKSDLDLLIVADAETARILSRTFIIGDVGFDIYCRRWADLERTAEFFDPHGASLFGDVVYTSSEEAGRRYADLRAKLAEKLRSPLCAADFDIIDTHCAEAVREYGRMCLEDAFGAVRFRAAGVMLYTEYALYLLNKKCVRRGIRGIPQEMAAFARLPDDYAEARRNLLCAADCSALRAAAKRLICGTQAVVESARQEIEQPQSPSADALCGTYEELISNWGNKMHRAARENDAYLSFMSAAAAELFFSEIGGPLDVEELRILSAREVSPEGTERAFLCAADAWRELCESTGTPICRYADTADFVLDYTRK